ncbi:MAG: S9 family peptidase [Candidatus Kariarchaeaceae archaeon]
MQLEPIRPSDYLKTKKIMDVNVSGNYIVWVERWPNPVKPKFNSKLKLLDKTADTITDITSGKARDYFPRFSPDGTKLAFLSTRDGKSQLFILEFQVGEAQKISNMRDGITWFEWSPDSSKIGFISYTNLDEVSENEQLTSRVDVEVKNLQDEDKIRKKSDPRVITKLVYRTGTSYKDEEKNFHIFNIDMHNYMVNRVSDGDFHHSEFTWINDDQIISLAKKDEPVDLSMTYSVLRFDVSKTSEGDKLTTVHNRSIDRFLPGPRAYPKGPILIPMLDEPLLFGKVLKRGLLHPNGDTTIINKELDRNIGIVKWLSETETVMSIDNQGKTELRRYDLTSSKFEKLFDHSASIESFDLNELNDIYYVGTEPMYPSALWNWNGEEAKLVYDPNSEFLKNKKIIEPREIWLENPEGIKYHGWFFDAGRIDGNKPPMVLSIHGGPDFMWNNAGTMWFEWQCTLSGGYSILAMNPIGSGGYGEKYAAEIKSSWGINDARDLLAGVDHVINEVDPERLYITGGSYAGFQTANIISRDHRFKAGCAQRGVYNLVTFSMVTDIPVWASHAWEGSVWDDDMIEKLWKHSPVARAPFVNTPLLIIHSENDFRVGISQAEELFNALKMYKKEAVFVRYPRDGHDLSREGEALHIIDRLERMLHWFDDHK